MRKDIVAKPPAGDPNIVLLHGIKRHIIGIIGEIERWLIAKREQQNKPTSSTR